MTSEAGALTRAKNINKPKALSALAVGGVSYPAVMRTIESVAENNGWEWLTSSSAHHWLGIVVAAVMSSIAAWRTSSDATPRQQRRADNRQAADLEQYRALKALDENGEDV